MNYSNIPRELIFQNRSSLDDYDVDNKQSVNSLFFDQMLNMDCLSPKYKETESQILAIFNDVYYILTLIFLEKRPLLRIGDYREIARMWPGYGVKFEREVIVLSMVFEILGLVKQELPNSVTAIKDGLENYLSTQTMYNNYRFSIWRKVDRYQKSDFLPREITETITNKVDWVYLTDNFNLENIQLLFDKLGRNSREKKIVINAIYNAEVATGNMSAIPYDVDRLLDKLHKEVDEKHRGIMSAYDARRESLNLDLLVEQKIENIMEKNYSTDKDIDEMFPETEPLLEQIENLKDQVNQLAREKAFLEQQLKEKESEQGFTATGNECFTKAKMGLLIYTIASIKDGPTPIKAQLVPIISAIGGWESTSVGTEMKKAGFNQSDIDAVAKLFEDAMPNFASEIKKQIPRRPKTKK